jgi:hypothetical protein
LTLSALDANNKDIPFIRLFKSGSAVIRLAILVLALLTAAKDTGPSLLPSSVRE